MTAKELLEQLQKLVLAHGDAQILIGNHKPVEHIGHKAIEWNEEITRYFIIQ